MVKVQGKAQVNARTLAQVKLEINQPRLTESVRRAIKDKRVAVLHPAQTVPVNYQVTKLLKALPVKRHIAPSRLVITPAGSAKSFPSLHE
jgi:hypothetical protein